MFGRLRPRRRRLAMADKNCQAIALRGTEINGCDKLMASRAMATLFALSLERYDAKYALRTCQSMCYLVIF